MEKRKELTVEKSNDPEKLLVFRAASADNQIRFYLNRTQYYMAFETKDGFDIEFGEDIKENAHTTSNLLIHIRKDIIPFTLKLLLSAMITLVCFFCAFYLFIEFDTLLCGILLLEITHLISGISVVLTMESTLTSQSGKSKHSAEHMMVNFLQNNKRLPKNFKELKKSSRFVHDCGCREKVSGVAERFIQGIIAFEAAFIGSIFIWFLFKEPLISTILVWVIYLITKYAVLPKYFKLGKLDDFVYPIENLLTRIAQCANTSRKVVEKDFVMAYIAARIWIKNVYPEFYNKEEDIWAEELTKKYKINFHDDDA